MDRMINELTIKEIDEIISWLQEPYPYELIKKLELLKEETIFWNKLQCQRMIDNLDAEKQLKKQGGFGTSPVPNAYFKIEEKE